MEVICPSCDRRLVIDLPTSSRVRRDRARRVRCTHCGSTFAFNPAQVQRGDPATDPVRWVRVEGEDFAVSDLATLQRWILEKRVLPQDVASCDGLHWFSLDSRAELTLFFDAADRMDRGPASAQHAMMTMSRSTASDIFADDAPLPEPDPLAGAAAIAEGMAADSTDMEAIAADEGDPSDDMGSLRLDFGQSSPEVRRRDGGDAHPVPPPALLGDEEAEAPSGPSAPAGSAAIRVGVLGGGSSAQRERSVPVVVQTRAADPVSRPLAADPASNPTAGADPRSGPTSPSRPLGASASEGAEVAGGWEDNTAQGERTEPVSVARAVKVPTLVKPPGAAGDGPSVARPTAPVPTQPVIPRGPPSAAQFSPGQATEERPNLTVRPEADPRAGASPWAIALVVASAVFVIVVAVQQFGGKPEAEAEPGRAGDAAASAAEPAGTSTPGASAEGSAAAEGSSGASTAGTDGTATPDAATPAATTGTPAATTATTGTPAATTGTPAATTASTTSSAATTTPTTAGATTRPGTTATTSTTGTSTATTTGATTRPSSTTTSSTGTSTTGATTRPTSTTTSTAATTTTGATTRPSSTTTSSTGTSSTGATTRPTSTTTSTAATATTGAETRPTTSTSSAPTTVISGSTTTTAKPPPATTTTTTAAKTKPSLSAAWALVQARDYQAAYDMFNTLAASGSSSAIYGRGYAAEKLGRTDAALADYCRAIASTNNEETLRELSAGLRRLGQTCP